MRIELTGTDMATCGDISITSRVSALCKVARKLIEGGVSPETNIEVFRDDVKCFNDAPLTHWASLTTTETDRVSVKHSPYVPFSGLT